MGMGGMGGMAGMGGMGGMGGMSMGSQFAMPTTTQAMHQSVMRHPSPAPGQGNSPPQTGSQGFMGF